MGSAKMYNMYAFLEYPIALLLLLGYPPARTRNFPSPKQVLWQVKPRGVCFQFSFWSLWSVSDSLLADEGGDGGAVVLVGRRAGAAVGNVGSAKTWPYGRCIP